MKKIIVLIFLSIISMLSYSQWNTLPSNTDYPLYSIYFTNTDVGYAVGGESSQGIILKTSNAGENWIDITPPSLNHILYSIYFLDFYNGYAVGENIILKTTNAGLTWTSVEVTAILKSVYFTYSDVGYSVGCDGIMLKTIDGENWLPLSNMTTKDLNSVFFTSPTTGFVVGDGGILLKTTDRGLTWTQYKVNGSFLTGKKLSSIYFLDFQTGYIVGDGGVLLETIDNGQTWELFNKTTLNLSSVHFSHSDNHIGYIVGEGGIIFRTSNKKDWNMIFYGGYYLNFVFPINNTICYATGENGTILKTINGGVLGSEDIKLSKFMVYPNPTSDKIIIISDIIFEKIIICDLNGKELITNHTDQNKISLDVSSLSKGLYFIRLQDENKIYSQKLIIK